MTPISLKSVGVLFVAGSLCATASFADPSPGEGAGPQHAAAARPAQQARPAAPQARPATQQARPQGGQQSQARPGQQQAQPAQRQGLNPGAPQGRPGISPQGIRQFNGPQRQGQPQAQHFQDRPGSTVRNNVAGVPHGSRGAEVFDHPTHSLAVAPGLRGGNFAPEHGWGAFHGEGHWGRFGGRPVFIFINPYIFNPFWPYPFSAGGIYFGWGWVPVVGWSWRDGAIYAEEAAWDDYLYEQYELDAEYGYYPVGEVALPAGEDITQFSTIDSVNQCGATQIALHNVGGAAFVDHVVVNYQDPATNQPLSQDIEVRTGLQPNAFTQFIKLEHPEACVTDVTVIGKSNDAAAPGKIDVNAVVPQ